MNKDEIRQFVLSSRWKHGVTQDELTKRSGLSQAEVSRYERGIRELRIDDLIQVAESLNCEVIMRDKV